jgi:TRAP-type mannitol/chloroaromatic compound transport system substrate-binding protein
METDMERRSFLSRATVGAGVGAALVAAPAVTHAQPTVRWRCSSGFPKALDTIFGAAEDVAKRISDATGGRFQISVAPAGEIVPMPQAADAVSGGTVECSHTAAFYYVGQDPTWAFGTAIPFGMNFRQHNAWWLKGGGEDLFNAWLRPRGMLHIISGNTGAQMGGWFRKEIRTMADVTGLKMRIPGLGGAVWRAAGAVPQQIAGGDIYAALERGTIDATEWVGPYDDEKLGFNRVARFYYHPGFWEGGAALGWLINIRAWEALPAEYRNIFTAAAHEANASMMADYDARNAAALRRLIAGGTQLRAFPRPVMQAFFDHAQRMYAEMSAANANFKRLFDHYTAFQREAVGWMRFTENAFDDFMAEALRPRPAGGQQRRPG